MENKSREHNKNNIEKAIMILLALGLIVSVINQVQLFSMKNSMIGNAVISTNTGSSNNVARGIATVEAAIIPKGTPEIYGSELVCITVTMNAVITISKIIHILFWIMIQ